MPRVEDVDSSLKSFRLNVKTPTYPGNLTCNYKFWFKMVIEKWTTYFLLFTRNLQTKQDSVYFCVCVHYCILIIELNKYEYDRSIIMYGSILVVKLRRPS